MVYKKTKEILTRCRKLLILWGYDPCVAVNITGLLQLFTIVYNCYNCYNCLQLSSSGHMCRHLFNFWLIFPSFSDVHGSLKKKLVCFRQWVIEETNVGMTCKRRFKKEFLNKRWPDVDIYEQMQAIVNISNSLKVNYWKKCIKQILLQLNTQKYYCNLTPKIT